MNILMLREKKKKSYTYTTTVPSTWQLRDTFISTAILPIHIYT